MIEDSQINNKKGVQLKTIRFLLYTFYYLYFTEPMLCKLSCFTQKGDYFTSSNIKYIDNQLVTVIKIQMICKCKYKTI